jgi:hypothetical protein
MPAIALWERAEQRDRVEHMVIEREVICWDVLDAKLR